MKSNQKQIIVVIDGPSGVGKDAIISGLIKRYPHLFSKAQSSTNRPMRPNESQGNPYFFISTKDFENGIATGEIFEHTTRHGTYRGMSKHIFDKILENEKIPLKDCDHIGLNALRKIYPGKIIGIFVNAPKEMIIARLLERDKNDTTIDARIADYDTFVETKKHFDHEVQNIELEKAIDDVIKLIENFYGEKIEQLQ